MADPRNIREGQEIPGENYIDQPCVVRTDDGAWLCIVTTGAGREGQAGQHIVTMRSTDQGKTWSEPVAVEPAEGPEASYAVLLKVPGGRIYCFYNHNTDNLRAVKAESYPSGDGLCTRVDSLGYFVLKYSDDDGRTWCNKRYVIPVREMAIDRENPYGGEVRFFWNVGKPFIHDGAGYVPLTKVGGFGAGFFTRSEGVLLKSGNILTEREAEKITWETLPDGEYGLRAPPGGGPIAEEQSYSVLSDGSFYCVYRTIDGHPAFAYSRNGGHTWSEPRYKRYADGRLMKHPRAANFVWKCSNGKFLYWFHNHGGRFLREAEDIWTLYDDRNPVWLCGGVEVDTPEGRIIQWSQPEIVLYDDDPYVRISYPDLIEEGGRYFLTESRKDVAFVNEIDRELLEGLWSQFENREVTTRGLVLSLPEEGGAMPSEAPMPSLPTLRTRDLRQGFALDMWIHFNSLEAGQEVLDSRTENGQGLCLRTAPRGTVEIVLNDGRTENRWDCDPGMLKEGTLQHLVVIVDAGPKIITFVVNGKLCDGGEYRQFGWGRFSPNLRHANGAKTLRIAPSLNGEIRMLRVYNQCLRTSEAVGNFLAGYK